MTTRDYILAVSVIINVILGYWIYDIKTIEQKPNEELLRSQGRVQILERQISEDSIKIKVLDSKIDSIKGLINAGKEKEKDIKEKYEKKANDIINLSIDSSIIILSRRLSEIDSIGW